MSVIKGSGLDEMVRRIAQNSPGPFTILEVGCGRFKHWEYPEGAQVSGVDISESQLDQNQHITEKFVGDVQTWETDRQWDVVISVYVLEHVGDPSRALANMVRWT